MKSTQKPVEVALNRPEVAPAALRLTRWPMIGGRQVSRYGPVPQRPGQHDQREWCVRGGGHALDQQMRQMWSGAPGPGGILCPPCKAAIEAADWLYYFQWNSRDGRGPGLGRNCPGHPDDEGGPEDRLASSMSASGATASTWTRAQLA
jgi:hypothetical protein